MVAQLECYCQEQLHLAVVSMASSDSSIQERLYQAHALYIKPLLAGEISSRLVQARLDGIIRVLEANGAREDLRFSNLEQKLAEQVAREIVSVYDQVTRQIS